MRTPSRRSTTSQSTQRPSPARFKRFERSIDGPQVRTEEPRNVLDHIANLIHGVDKSSHIFEDLLGKKEELAKMLLGLKKEKESYKEGITKISEHFSEINEKYFPGRQTSNLHGGDTAAFNPSQTFLVIEQAESWQSDLGVCRTYPS